MSWTGGYRGSGAAVTGGHVLTGSFPELGWPDQPFSIALWAKPHANAKVLVHAAVNPTGGDGWCIPILGHDANGRVLAQVLFDANPDSLLIATGPQLALDRWNHVAITWTANDGVRMYIDGELAASAAPKSASERKRHAPALPLHVLFGSDNGARCWTGAIEAGPWTGVLDELHVYNYALTAGEIAAAMRR